MKMFQRGRMDVYRRVKVAEEEVSLDEGFYTFCQRSPQRASSLNR